MHSSARGWIEVTVYYGKTKSNVNFATEQNYICTLEKNVTNTGSHHDVCT